MRPLGYLVLAAIAAAARPAAGQEGTPAGRSAPSAVSTPAPTADSDIVLKKMPLTVSHTLPVALPAFDVLKQWWISAYYADGKNQGPATEGKVHAGNMFDIAFVTPDIIATMPVTGTPLADQAKEIARRRDYGQTLVQRLTEQHIAFYGALYVIGNPNGRAMVMSPWKFALRTGTGGRLAPVAVTFGNGGEDPVHINRPEIGPDYWMRTVLVEFDTTDPISKRSLITDKVHSYTLEIDGPCGPIRAKYYFDPTLPAQPPADEAHSAAPPAPAVARAVPPQPQRFPFAVDWLDNQSLLELRGGDDIGWDAGQVTVRTGASAAYAPLYTAGAEAAKIDPNTDVWLSPEAGRKSLLLRDGQKWDLLDTTTGMLRSWTLSGRNAAWLPDGATWLEWTDPYIKQDPVPAGTNPAPDAAAPTVTQVWVHSLADQDETVHPTTLQPGGVIVGPVDAGHVLMVDKVYRHSELPASVTVSSVNLKTGEETPSAATVALTGGILRYLWDTALSPARDRIAWLVIEARERKNAPPPTPDADGSTPTPEQRVRYDADLVASVWVCSTNGVGLRNAGFIPLQEHDIGIYRLQPGAALAPGGLRWSPDGSGVIFRYAGVVYGVAVN